MSYDPILIKLDTPADDFFQTLVKCNENFAAISTAFGSLQGAFTFLKTSVTGGVDPLNGIDGASLADGMTTVVVQGNNPASIAFYVLDEDKGGSENLPYVVIPLLNPGNKRWVLGARIPRLWAGVSAPTVNTDSSIGVNVGDMWRVDTDVWFCADATTGQAIWLPWLRIGSTDYTACAGNDGRLPTNDQRAALAGTSGAPSNTNRYVTQQDPSTSNARVPTAHKSSHGEGGTDELTDLPSGIVASGSVVGTHITTPPVPPGGFCSLYFKADGNLYCLDHEGLERSIQGNTVLHADDHLLETGGDPIQTLPSSAQKAALAGAGVGSPSDTNRYVLEDNLDLTGPRVPTAHASEHEPEGSDPIDDLPGNVKIEGAIDLAETTTPANPSANRHRIYPKADGKLYHLNSAGVEVEIGANLDAEAVQDIVGAMLNGALTGITLTYDDTNGKINASVSYGSTAGTACQGNDSRLGDERDPTIHDSTKHSVTYAVNSDLTAHTGAASPHSGHATLVGGKIPIDQLPAVAITDTFPVASQAEMLALTAQRGDVAIRNDESKTYILAADDPTILTNWLQIITPSDLVSSVDGRTGVVTLGDLYAPLGKGVTNGDSHDHNGGDGAQIDHVNLANKGSNTHAQIDTALTAAANHETAAAPHSGHATTGSVTTVAGDLTTHTSAAAPHSGHVQIGGQLGGTTTSPTVTGVTESGGQTLTMGAVADGQALVRNGTSVVGSAVSADIDVVGGRVDLVSATSIKWAFLNSNQIMLHNGTAWTLVKVATEPTAANTATDINGDALAVDTIYDVFAKYNSATAFDLVFAKWAASTAGSSVRFIAWADATAYKIGARRSQGTHYYACILAHTSATANDQPGSGTNWQNYWLDCGTDPGADFRGLYQLDGRRVYGPNASGSTSFDGRKYRWLGVVYTLSNAGTVNFADDSVHRYISNFYNPRTIVVTAYNSTASWAFGSTTARESNGGTGQNRGYCVLCIAQMASFSIQQFVVTGADSDAIVGPAIDSNTMRIFSVAQSINENDTITASRSESIGAGIHYLTSCESSSNANASTYYGTTGSHYVEIRLLG